MGFLLGMYGKLMAGKRVRQLQADLTSVSMRLNRVTKQAAQMEKMFQSQERMFNTTMTQWMTEQRNQMMPWGILNMKDPTSNQLASANQDYQGYMYGLSYLQQVAGLQSAVMAEQFDMMRESQLQPLKDLQDELETEKDSLESQLQLAKQEYDAKKQEEKDGAKNMAPDYTGSGQ